MNFFKSLLASILGFFIAIFLLFFLVIAFSVAIGASMMEGEGSVVKKSKSVLELDFKSQIKDYSPSSNNPVEKLLKFDEKRLSLNKIIKAIERAKTDDDILGISIKTSMFSAGVAQLQSIRDKIEEFKKSGKFVYAYNDFYAQKNYYLSSVADSLFLNPVGSIEFTGLSTEVLFFKDFQEKYGVKMEVIRHGKYKSAVEPFIANKMSEANREQTTSFLKSIWTEIIDDISLSRKISIENINLIADNSFGRSAELSKQNKLIDDAIYEDEYNAKLKLATKSKKLRTIPIADYISLETPLVSDFLSKNKIAVIYAQGEIGYGEGNENVIGQGLTNKSIKKAVKDDAIKAIVLRVNSPGGSALASELIWRELELAKKKKPLIVSMGNLAASGGYYISAGATKIFAEPTTITGSIGVFGALPNVHQLSTKMGINSEKVSTNNSVTYSLFKPMDKKYYDVTKEGVEFIYKTFVNRVANGRKMTFEQVNEIAQGRVWSGKEALDNGLVDKLGNLDDAIAYASELVKVEDYTIVNYPDYKKELKDMFSQFPFGKVDKDKILLESMGEEAYRLFKHIEKLKSMKGIQARLPYPIELN